MSKLPDKNDFQPWQLLIPAFMAIAGMLVSGLSLPHVFLYGTQFSFDFGLVAVIELALQALLLLLGLVFLSFIPKNLRVFKRYFNRIMREGQGRHRAGAVLFLAAFGCVSLVVSGYVCPLLGITPTPEYEQFAMHASRISLIAALVGAALLFRR